MTSEIRRGWLLILASSIGVACSSIVLPYYSLGSFVKPLASEFGWARGDVLLALLLTTGLGALTAPLIGWLSDRYGPRRVAIPALLGVALGLVLASRNNGSLFAFHAAYACMALLGAGTIPVTWTRAIATSFERQRGLALGLTLTGSGVCGVLAPIYSVWLIDHYGWRTAYLGLALLPIAVALPLAYVGFKSREPESTREVETHTNAWGITVGEALRDYRFWILAVSIMAIYLAVSGIGPNLIPSLTDKGMAASRAAQVQSALGASIIVGRLTIGYLIDRFWAPGVAAIALSVPIVGCLILTQTTDFIWVLSAVVLIGIAAGAELDLMSFLAARYFGVRHYAKIYALLYAALALAGGVAPTLFATVFDRTASYDIGYWVAAVFFGFGAFILLAMGRYPANAPSR